MGKYINQNSKGETLPATGKAKALIADGATVVDGKTFQENLVCVVENGFFDAAAYAYDQREFNDFSDAGDRRRKTWLIVPNADTLAK